MQYVVDIKNPLFLFTHLTAIAHSFNLEKYLSNISSKLPDSKFILSGQMIQNYKKMVPQNVEIMKSLVEVMEHIKTI